MVASTNDLQSGRVPQSCRRQYHTHPGSNTCQSRSGHPMKEPVYRHKQMFSELSKHPLDGDITQLCAYLTWRVFLVCVQYNVRVSIIESAIIPFRPMGHLSILSICTYKSIQIFQPPTLNLTILHICTPTLVPAPSQAFSPWALASLIYCVYANIEHRYRCIVIVIPSFPSQIQRGRG